MRPTFEKTVDILVKAYLNDTLKHGECEMCAVGNIVHAAGFPRYNTGRMLPDSCGMWKNVFYTDEGKQNFGNRKNNGQYYVNGVEMIRATGYKIKELAMVEYTFETAPTGNNTDESMFNGLMAVVDVLAEIHNVDLSVREEAKSLFVKA